MNVVRMCLKDLGYYLVDGELFVEQIRERNLVSKRELGLVGHVVLEAKFGRMELYSKVDRYDL